MLHRSRFLFLLLGSAAATAACTHPAPDARSAPPAGADARSPHTVGSSRGPAGAPAAPPPGVHPFASALEGSALALADLDGRTVAYVADEDDAVSQN